MLEGGRLIVTAALVVAMGGWFGNLRGSGSRAAVVLFAALSLAWVLGEDRRSVAPVPECEAHHQVD
jgi:hypothetical protein